MKQVIVMRKDLNMRKGKMCAQAAHASLGAYFKALDHILEWEDTGATKICVGVDSLEELHLIGEAAKQAGLLFYAVLDAGRTEFKEPTYTCLAIGPAPDEEIDKITGHLKLL